MTEKTKRRLPNIVAIISIILFASTALGWAYSIGQNSRDKSEMKLDIINLKTEVIGLKEKDNDLDKSIGIVDANLVLLLTHFGITPATTKED